MTCSDDFENGDYHVETKHEDGRLTVTVRQDQEFGDLEGGTTTAPVKVAEIILPDDREVVGDIGHALLGWHAEQGSSGPPGQKPIHDQYADMEPDP